jgi:hypothetical protein
MKFSLRLCLISIALVGLALLPAVPTRAASPNVVIVRWGDTLAGIAARTGTNRPSVGARERIAQREFHLRRATLGCSHDCPRPRAANDRVASTP